MAANVAKSPVDAPDFLRLGLMLALERRPTEPRGRTVFLQVRDIATQKITEVAGTVFPDLDEDAVRMLATDAVAGADGLFVHLCRLWAPHGRAVHPLSACAPFDAVSGTAGWLNTVITTCRKSLAVDVDIGDRGGLLSCS